MQARAVAQAAAAWGARAVAHGSTAAGNDQVRFEAALRALLPEAEILAPIRDGGTTRAQEVAYLAKHGLQWPESRAAYSINAGLWGCTIGGRETNTTTDPLPEEAWVLTRGAFDAPRPAESHAVAFEQGIPSALDGEALPPVELIEKLNRLAGSFGVGRGIHLGDTILGLKGRVAFEAPAATVLIQAHRELEKLVLTARQQRLKDTVSAAYGDFIHEGLYYDPVCRDAEALLLRSQERVTGEVRVLLRPGSCFVEGVSSPFSMKAASKAVYGESAGEWTAQDARGFSRLFSLQSVLYARAGKGGGA
ncbi:MAG: argininosuccinate synthase [Acidobacteriota bacterium]